MHEITAWLAEIGWDQSRIEVASADASFRRYFRVTKGGRNSILMDASQEIHTLEPYLDVTHRLLSSQVRAPRVFEESYEKGYLLIEDFGSTHYLNLLNEANFDTLYRRAIDEIVKMHAADASGLPPYDRAFLLQEMRLMETWFLRRYLGWEIDPVQRQVIDAALDAIADIVLSQPHGVFVHRDYHSRNIMLTPDGEIGVIDFQDAMNGAITYDLVSLLKDCYIRFDPDAVNALALRFRDRVVPDVDNATFLKWFDFMGLQRHIKVLGVFSRLWLRDGKMGYLGDLPLVLRYTIEAAERYSETGRLAALLKRVELPPLPPEATP